MKLRSPNSALARDRVPGHSLLLLLLGADDMKSVEQVRHRLARMRCARDAKIFAQQIPRHD